MNEQNTAIYAKWKGSRKGPAPPTYSEIGRQFGVNRNVVAGAVCRGREGDKLEASFGRAMRRGSV